MSIIYLVLIPFYLSSQPFEQVSEVLFLQDDLYLISTVGGSHHAHVFNAAKDSIMYSFIRNGGGPGEARGVRAMSDCGDDTIVYIGSEGKVLQFDKEFTLIREMQTVESSVYSFFCDGNNITVGYTSIFSLEKLQSDDYLEIGAVYDLEMGKKTGSIKLKGSDIYLGKNARFNNVSLLFVDMFVAVIKPDTYLVAIDGSPVVYLINDGNIVMETFNHTGVSETGYTEIKHPHYGYGQRKGAVNNNWQVKRVDDNLQFHFYYGNAAENIEFGYAEVSVDSGNGVDITFHELESGIQSKLNEMESSMKIVRGKNHQIIWGVMPEFANYVYVNRVE